MGQGEDCEGSKARAFDHCLKQGDSSASQVRAREAERLRGYLQADILRSLASPVQNRPSAWRQ